MRRRTRRARGTRAVVRGAVEPVEWGHRKLLAVLTATVVLGLALLAGLGFSVYYTLQPDPDDQSLPSAHAGAEGVTAAREEIASRPMPSVAPEAARPGPLSTQPFERLQLPGARTLGPAGVSTGFPQTPEGALAQLVAIDQAALQAASVPGAQTVVEAWAAPGGPTVRSWSGVRAIGELLAAAGLPASGSPALTVSATPELGLIKGTVGSAYVVACVNFVVTAIVTTTARVAAADCQRMVWSDGPRQEAGRGRWLIGPGPEPAQPPSVWPGTQAAQTAGYRELTHD